MNKNEGVKQSKKRSVLVRSVVNARLFRQSQLRNYSLLILALALLAAVCAPAYYSRRVEAQDVRARLDQDLGQVFADHEDVVLDPQSVVARVKETGRMSLRTRSHSFELQLRPNDLRASNYRAEEVGSDGVSHPVSMSGVSTYKGNIEGVWGSEARFTLNDNKIEGMIITPNETFYVESAQKFSLTARPTDYVVYEDSDVRPDVTRQLRRPAGKQGRGERERTHVQRGR